MKTILVLTDFSAHAKYAAEYALKLAQKIKADVLLCNTFLVAAEMPMAGLSVWPQEEYSILSEDSAYKLDELKELLQHQADTEKNTFGFHPDIATISTTESIGDLAGGPFPSADIQLVVVGTHGKDGLSNLITGNNVNKVIDHLDFPLLIVPPSAVSKPIEKIAFAVDLVDVEKDEKSLYKLVDLARLLNAEILVTHVYNEKNISLDFKKQIKALLTNISNKANYANIYSRIVDEENPEKGLNWLCENGQVDILAMTHQDQNLFERIFGSSHTHKMAGQISIPLLVLPNRP